MIRASGNQLENKILQNQQRHGSCAVVGFVQGVCQADCLGKRAYTETPFDGEKLGQGGNSKNIVMADVFLRK